MANVRCGLPGLLTQHHCLRIDQSESIYHNLTFDTLDWIHHYCNRPLVQSFKTLRIHQDCNLEYQSKVIHIKILQMIS